MKTALPIKRERMFLIHTWGATYHPWALPRLLVSRNFFTIGQEEKFGHHGVDEVQLCINLCSANIK
jgi:hypothetical protein